MYARQKLHSVMQTLPREKRGTFSKERENASKTDAIITILALTFLIMLN